TDIHKSFDDLASDAKTEIALYPRSDDAREGVFGSGHPRWRHQSDDRSFLPRVAHGRGFLRAKGERDECGRPKHREQHAPQHDSGSPFHAHRLTKMDCVRTLY